MSRHTLCTTWEIETADDYRMANIEVEFEFARGYAESRPTLDHSGRPGEPDEVDCISAHEIDANGKSIPLPEDVRLKLLASETIRERCIDEARG